MIVLGSWSRHSSPRSIRGASPVCPFRARREGGESADPSRLARVGGSAIAAEPAAGPTQRGLGALPEARSILDAEAPEVLEAAVERDLAHHLPRGREERLAGELEAPLPEELHRGIAAVRPEPSLDGPGTDAGQRREVGQG